MRDTAPRASRSLTHIGRVGCNVVGARNFSSSVIKGALSRNERPSAAIPVWRLGLITCQSNVTGLELRLDETSVRSLHSPPDRLIGSDYSRNRYAITINGITWPRANLLYINKRFKQRENNLGDRNYIYSNRISVWIVIAKSMLLKVKRERAREIINNLCYFSTW